jgi:type II secretory pathway pseudopilin PulG
MDRIKSIILKEKMFSSNRGQVWVETVIYTLIGLAVMGILLAASKPKIEQMRDKIVIEQTITSLNDISSRIYDVQIAPGNKRILNLQISKGTFYINASENKIGWILNSNSKYSEVNSPVKIGNLMVLTRLGAPYIVEIYTNYTVNLTFDGKKDFNYAWRSS